MLNFIFRLPVFYFKGIFRIVLRKTFIRLKVKWVKEKLNIGLAYRNKWMPTKTLKRLWNTAFIIDSKKLRISRSCWAYYLLEFIEIGKEGYAEWVESSGKGGEMKVLQINAISRIKSTGRLCVEIADYLNTNGQDGYIVYSKGLSYEKGYKIGAPFEKWKLSWIYIRQQTWRKNLKKQLLRRKITKKRLIRAEDGKANTNKFVKRWIEWLKI